MPIALFTFLNGLKQVGMAAQKHHRYARSPGNSRSCHWQFFLLKISNGCKGDLALLFRLLLGIFSTLLSFGDSNLDGVKTIFAKSSPLNF
jgi:hypothetical protein